MMEVFDKCPDKEKEKIIFIIINKFGDGDSKIINEMMNAFSKPFSVIFYNSFSNKYIF